MLNKNIWEYPKENVSRVSNKKSANKAKTAKPSPAPKRPYEIFNLTEQEVLYWRVSKDRFQELIDDDNTVIHEVNESSNNFGDFIFVTTSRPGDQGRICMTWATTTIANAGSLRSGIGTRQELIRI